MEPFGFNAAPAAGRDAPFKDAAAGLPNYEEQARLCAAFLVGQHAVQGGVRYMSLCGVD